MDASVSADLLCLFVLENVSCAGCVCVMCSFVLLCGVLSLCYVQSLVCVICGIERTFGSSGPWLRLRRGPIGARGP